MLVVWIKCLHPLHLRVQLPLQAGRHLEDLLGLLGHDVRLLQWLLRRDPAWVGDRDEVVETHPRHLGLDAAQRPLDELLVQALTQEVEHPGVVARLQGRRLPELDRDPHLLPPGLALDARAADPDHVAEEDVAHLWREDLHDQLPQLFLGVSACPPL